MKLVSQYKKKLSLTLWSFTLRVLCTVDTKLWYRWSFLKCILAPVNWVSMVTNMRILLLYTLSLKLELVCHLVFNRHEIFTKATSVILLRKRVGIALSGVEQCDNKQRFS